MDSIGKRVVATLAAMLALTALATVVSNSSSSSSETSSMAQTQLFDQMSATTELFDWPWQATAEAEFSSDDYQAQTATQKMGQIWSAVMKNTEASTYSKLKTAAIFLEDLSESFTWMGDTLPKSHVKSIHSVGNVAQAEWVSSGDHPFTGVFEGWKQVLVRLSSAVAPGIDKGVTSLAPGMGVKFLRDGEPSSNFVAMWSVNGQESMNMFENTWFTHIGTPTSNGPKVLAKKFASKQGGTYGFVQQVGLLNCATPGKVYPYSLEFRPTDEVKKQYTAIEFAEYSFLDQLSGVPEGTPLFEIWAKAGPNSDMKKIGSLKTTSAMTTSKFGDESLFFRHAYELPDIENACDNGLPDCKDWLKETARFTDSTFPFGSHVQALPSGIPGERRSERSGCPLLFTKQLEEKTARINQLEAQLKTLGAK